MPRGFRSTSGRSVELVDFCGGTRPFSAKAVEPVAAMCDVSRRLESLRP